MKVGDLVGEDPLPLRRRDRLRALVALAVDGDDVAEVSEAELRDEIVVGRGHGAPS